MNAANHTIQVRLCYTFDPNMHLVIPCGDIREAKSPACIGLGIKSGRKRQDHSAHFRMDVAKNVRDAFAREGNRLCRACFVEAQVKSLSIEQRKHVVKERVGVGKLYHTTDWNNQ